MAEKQEIHIDDIKALVKELKKCDESWVNEVARRMKKSESSMNVTKVHNIVNSGVKNPKLRAMFMVSGGQYLEELKLQQEEAAKYIQK